ncbi:bacterial aa3 type cytochrome c oxidase subunit IV family protein [Brucella abortus]|nr:bacterial aa3 type cytochrome c oxidase subunit IV family protein [Brucella abortus]
MAEHHTTAPAELGAPMDYAEHEKTYAGFAGLVKWATVVLVALMIAMAFGFFAGGFFLRPFFSFLSASLPGSFFRDRCRRMEMSGMALLN